MAINIFNKNASANISMPKPKLVHGIEVKKVPIGVYLDAMGELEGLPMEILQELFPGKNMTEVIAQLMTLTDAGLANVIMRLLKVAPEYIITVLAKILGVDKARIRDGLTPKEVCDVAKEYWKMNDMTDFFANVSGLILPMLEKLPTPNTGSKNGSPLPKP